MAKTKLNLCITSRLCFLLYFVVLIVAGNETDSSALDPSQNPDPDPVEDSELSFAFQRLAQIVGKRSREQGKIIEEMKQQIQSLQSTQKTCNENVKSLSTKLDAFKSKISEDDGVWLLTPPLRGPPGQQGKQGEKGDTGAVGPKGERGQAGQKGDTGAKGETGLIGTQGKGGENEAPGPKGERGFSAALQSSITSCSAAMKILPSPRSKKQTIHPHGNRTSLEVLCDFEVDGGGWTIIQTRTSGPKQEFKQNWTAYANGFGSIDKNFWLGLDNIHALTKDGDQELRIELEDFEGNKKYAKYSSFSISDASDFYRLSISGYSGTANDSMTSSTSGYGTSNGMRFSTKDKENDKWSGNCAVEYFGGGGWWYNQCGDSNLNGFYFEKGEPTSWNGINWANWKGWTYSLAKTEMKIRTKKS